MSDVNKDGRSGDIGQRIKFLRRSVGLSQANLGNALGVTFQQIQKYENGKSRIAAEKLQQIAHSLGVDVGYFYKQQPASDLVEKAARPVSQTTPESEIFKDSFDKIRDPRARYLLAELARVFSEIETDR